MNGPMTSMDIIAMQSDAINNGHGNSGGAEKTPSLSSADDDGLSEEGSNHSNAAMMSVNNGSPTNGGRSSSLLLNNMNSGSSSHNNNHIYVASPTPTSSQQTQVHPTMMIPSTSMMSMSMHRSASMNSLNSAHSNRRQIYLARDRERQISGDGSVPTTTSPNRQTTTNHPNNNNTTNNNAQPVMKTITLKLVRERPAKKNRRRSVSDLAVSFSSLNRSFRFRGPGGNDGSSNSVAEAEGAAPKLNQQPSVDFTTVGEVMVSWFDGTTSDELYRHVEASITKVLGEEIMDFILLNPLEHSKPPQEVVLSPSIPHGSTFLVKFTEAPPARVIYRPPNTPPESPSAATPIVSFWKSRSGVAGSLPMPLSLDGDSVRGNSNNHPAEMESRGGGVAQQQTVQAQVISSATTTSSSGNKQQATTPIIMGKKGERVMVVTQTAEQEKKHVIFNLANYFVLFLSIIAISAELAERAPAWVEENIAQVNQCAVDQETLFKCINNGDMAGVIAAFSLWIAKSQATKRMFLFGFQSVNQLWTVVYESFVAAFCWGFSYMFIRRGLNPDSRERFLSRYWKDCVYGSMAGFNASFMKSVLKNLIPKEVIEEAVMDTKQLRLVDWFIRSGRDA